MSDPIPVNLAVEDALSEAVLRRILADYGGPWAIGKVFSRGGLGYLRRMIAGFNNAARGAPFVVLADLDQADCAPNVLPDWLPHGSHDNLLLRFAVREIEAWLLADAASLATFLGVQLALLPAGVEALPDPKEKLVGVARRSRKREIIADVVPKTGSTAVVGRNYSARLVHYVQIHWNPQVARHNSDSLDRAISALAEFEPSWE